MRTLLQPGEQVSGTLDFRENLKAALDMLNMNNPDGVVPSAPYICSQYSVSLVSKETVYSSRSGEIHNEETADANSLITRMMGIMTAIDDPAEMVVINKACVRKLEVV